MYNICVVLYSYIIVPGSVINIEVANLSSSELRVNWTAPESGGPVHSYHVSVSTATEERVAIMTDSVFINIINLSKILLNTILLNNLTKQVFCVCVCHILRPRGSVLCVCGSCQFPWVRRCTEYHCIHERRL